MRRSVKILLEVLLLALLVFLYIFFPPFTGELSSIEGVPTFEEIPVDFTHVYAGANHPFLGAAIIDVEGDDSYEIFVGGGEGQDDALLSYQDDKFSNIIANTGLSDLAPTHGAVSLDINNDNQVDLLVARKNGLFMYLNQDGTFQKQEIPLNLEEDSFPLSVAPGDINNDGFVDLYVSTFVVPKKFKSLTFNDPQHGKENILLLNNGDNTFTDITKESGAGLDQNTFLTAFVDLNDDKKQDLVISPNTDQVRIFENLGGQLFKEIEVPTGFGAWMGLATSDYDNDGDEDLYFSNMGNFVPKPFLGGDLRDDQPVDPDWALLENQGNFEFTQKNKEKGLTNKEFAWGAAFADFNLDGRSDLLVGENYLKLWQHHVRKLPGRFFVQDEQGNFLPVIRQAGLENKHFGQSPLLVDLNDDGRMDVIYVNMDGPLRALLNKGAENNYVKVVMPDSVKSLGAKVTVEQSGEILTQRFIPGTGLLTDQTPELIFGLGDYEGAVTITVHWRSGEFTTLQAEANSKVVV